MTDGRNPAHPPATARLILRPFRDSDVEPFASMNADPKVMRYFPCPLTRDETTALIARNEAHFGRHGFGLWAAELRATGEFAGFIGLMVPSFHAHFTPCIEIGWRLAARFWNRGLATEGARSALEFAFHSLGLAGIVSFAAEGNARSRRVMEKLGMQRNPADDFDHPLLAPGHPLSRHVLYRISRTGQPG